MKEKIMSKSEIRDFVIWYMTNKTDEKTLKDYKQFEKFIMEESDIAESLIRENVVPRGYPNYYEIKFMTELFKIGRCADIALEEVQKEMTNEFIFCKKEHQQELWGYEWEKADENQLIDWLLCRTDTLPAVIPNRIDPHYFLHHDYMEKWFAAISNVCDFPVRYCAHSMYNGVSEYFKYAFRSLILYREYGYADAVVMRIREIFSADFKLDSDKIDEIIMKGFAVVYCKGDKKKKETVYYQKYIDEWMKTDKERFQKAIQTIWSHDLRKNVIKKLTGSVK
ncbi:MAG: hypothetical protein IJ666_07610 [Ruminococcus sp.]|nr:hypothetical protein [Ruminococcus sp.]